MSNVPSSYLDASQARQNSSKKMFLTFTFDLWNTVKDKWFIMKKNTIFYVKILFQPQNHLALYFANKGGGTQIGERELGIWRKHYHYPVHSLPRRPHLACWQTDIHSVASKERFLQPYQMDRSIQNMLILKCSINNLQSSIFYYLWWWTR